MSSSIKPPFFSVIIPVFNRESTIGPALDSVLSQTFGDYEVIVIDDGSSDESVAVAETYSKLLLNKLHVITQPNSGPGAARNNGIRIAGGQYIAFLDSDDLWFPWTLARFKEVVDEQGHADFVCGVPIDIHRDQIVEADNKLPFQIETHPDFFSVPGNPFFRFTTSGVVVRRSSLLKVGGFSGDRINYEDLDLWMRLGVEKGFVLITQPPQVVRRFLGDNISASREHNINGASFMIHSEKAGRYPGGIDRQGDRRRLLGVLMRAASFAFVRSGDRRSALTIYFQIFIWSIMQCRLRYLFGLPVQAIFTRRSR